MEFPFISKLKALSAKKTPQKKAQSDIDPEILAEAKDIIQNRQLMKSFGKGKRGNHYRDPLAPNFAELHGRLFARTIGDMPLANRFADKAGTEYRNLTLKKAAGMDGLRDIDTDVIVSSSAAGPSNPEGIVHIPKATPFNGSGFKDLSQRYNEALDPRTFAVIPDLVMEHFAKFGTFIGYPACELIATHPTVSNACTIPGEDAIAPGYKLQFIDSEDINGNGIKDKDEGDNEDGIQATTAALQKIKLLKVLNKAIVNLSTPASPDAAKDAAPSEAIESLAVAITRLNAYSGLSERNHELYFPLVQSINEYLETPVDQSRDRAFRHLLKVVAAMDSGDFDYMSPDQTAVDGISKNSMMEAANRNEVEIAKNQAEAEAKAREEAEAQKAQADQAAQQQEAMAQAQAQEETEKREKEEEAKRAAEEAKRRQKYLEEWKKRADDMGMNAILTKLARNARVYGIGIAVPIIEGADYSKPFNIKNITHGSYKGFQVIEPTWIYPETGLNDLVNPLSPYFYEPEYWQLIADHMSIEHRVHRSWMIICRNKEVPNRLKPMYYFGGIPLPQEIYEAVLCADKVMNEAPKLAMTKRTYVIKGETEGFITDPEGTVERLSSMARIQDNFGRLYVDRNVDVTQLDTTLSEFDQLISKQNQRVAAIAQMPETKLFKTQLAGMNSAGRYEWDDYAQRLMSIQSGWYTPLLDFHFMLDSLSQTGNRIQVKVVWNPIDVPTMSERQDAESRRVQTVVQAIQAEMISKDEGRQIIRGGDESMFSALPAINPVDKEKEEEAKRQQQPGGGDNPLGGGGGLNLPGLGGLGGIGKGNSSPLKAPQAPEPKK